MYTPEYSMEHDIRSQASGTGTVGFDHNLIERFGFSRSAVFRVWQGRPSKYSAARSKI